MFNKKLKSSVSVIFLLLLLVIVVVAYMDNNVSIAAYTSRKISNEIESIVNFNMTNNDDISSNIAQPANVTSEIYTTCNTFDTSHGSGRENGYSPEFLHIGCCNYRSNGFRLGITDIPYYIDETTMTAERAEIIREQAEMWNQVVMHDGTGQIVNLYEVESVSAVDRIPVATIKQEILSGNSAGVFYHDKINPLIKVSPNMHIDTPVHELGHLLGLGDLESDETGIEQGTHKVLMAYDRGTNQNNLKDAIEYQDIQGVAVFNNRHTSHVYSRYVVDNNKYRHFCFYCDMVNTTLNPLAGSLPMILAESCVHTYEQMVSSADRHWLKCNKCYKVIESEFLIECLNNEEIKIIANLNSDNKYVVIPSNIGGDRIVDIIDNLFVNNSVVTGISLPNTLENIGDNAFKGCTSLTSINMPSSLLTIGSQAFAGCVGLTSINIPSGVTSIGDGAFAGCDNLSISKAALNSNFTVENNIVYDSGKTKIITGGAVPNTISIPSTVTQIGAYAFDGNDNIESVDFGFNNPSVGTRAFANCANLDEVYYYAYETPNITPTSFTEDDFTLYVPQCMMSDYATAFYGNTFTIAYVPTTVNFVSEGTIVSTASVYYGQEISSLPTVAKTGYTLDSWRENIDLTGASYGIGDTWDEPNNMYVYAKWSPNQYYVYFSGYGADNLADKIVTYDAAIGEMPIVERTGYTFNGWRDENGRYYTAETVWDRTSSVLVESHLSANEYVISYNGNGGTPSVESQSVAYDETINEFPTAAKEGYTFVGWNTAQDGSGQNITAPYTYTTVGDMTLYAQYVANEYSVTFDKQGGSGGSDGVDAEFLQDMPLAVAPTRTGYVFRGYFTGIEGSGTQYYDSGMNSVRTWNIAGDTTLYADWEGISYEISFDKQGGSGGSDGVDAVFGSLMPSANKPSKTGYTFMGYFTGQNGTGTKYYDGNMNSVRNLDIPQNTTLYADWDGIYYTVTLDKQGGTGGSSSVSAQFGEDMPSADAPNRDGYNFMGYFTGENGTGTQYYDGNMNSVRTWDIAGDTTLYAKWVGNTYTVMFNFCGGSGGSTGTTVTFGSAMPTDITAPSKLGYTFKGYYSDTDGYGVKYYDGPGIESAHIWDIVGNATLYAYWEKVYYTVTYESRGDINLSRTASVAYGEALPLYSEWAPTRPGYEFVGYFSQINGNGTKYVTKGYKNNTQTAAINGTSEHWQESLVSTGAVWSTYGNGTVYGHWKLLEMDYTYQNLNVDGYSVLSTSTIHIRHGVAMSLTAASISEYTFKHFLVNGAQNTSNPITITFNLSFRTYMVGQNSDGSGGKLAVGANKTIAAYYEKDACLAQGSLITLADGRQVPVESLTGNESLLVWNLHTGRFDVAPILFIDSDPLRTYEVINLRFSDGTTVKVISQHGFWNVNLNKYVYLDRNAAQYLGHWFNKQITDENGLMTLTQVQLVEVVIANEQTTAWSPVTYSHLCYYVNGMLSMPGGISGLFNIFEVDGQAMKINETLMAEDITEFGLFTYEEFALLVPVSREVFDAFCGQYLKVAIGKELIDVETLQALAIRYAEYF